MDFEKSKNIYPINKESDPNICDRCGSDQMTVISAGTNVGLEWQMKKCSICGYEWQDIYKQSGRQTNISLSAPSKSINLSTLREEMK